MPINAIAQTVLDEDLIDFLKEGTNEVLTVLLVEDERAQALLLSSMLRRYGHTVHIADSG